MLAERKYSIMSLILGIIGLFYCGLIAGSLALTFSIIAIAKNYKRSDVTAGLMLGIICICLVLVQGMGLDFDFRLETVKFFNAYLLGSPDPYSLTLYIYTTLEQIARHLNALTASIFLGGAIPFHWIYSVVYSL